MEKEEKSSKTYKEDSKPEVDEDDYVDVEEEEEAEGEEGEEDQDGQEQQEERILREHTGRETSNEELIALVRQEERTRRRVDRAQDERELVDENF